MDYIMLYYVQIIINRFLCNNYYNLFYYEDIESGFKSYNFTESQLNIIINK